MNQWETMIRVNELSYSIILSHAKLNRKLMEYEIKLYEAVWDGDKRLSLEYIENNSCR